MPYRKSRYTRKTAKRVYVKPKTNWTLARLTAAGQCNGPSKNSSGQYDGPRVCTYGVNELVRANADTNTMAGMTKKIKHMKVEISRSFVAANEVLHKSLIKMKAYLMYIPQGLSFTTKYDTTTGLALTLANHPEWVLAEKTLNCNYSNTAFTVSNQTLSCRLAKNLRSGDSLVCVIAAYFNTATLGSTDLSNHAIPYNLEYTWAQAM